MEEDRNMAGKADFNPKKGKSREEIQLSIEDLEHYCGMFKKYGPGSDYCVITGLLGICSKLEYESCDVWGELFDNLRDRFGRCDNVKKFLNELKMYSRMISDNSNQGLEGRSKQENADFASRSYHRLNSRYDQARKTVMGRILRY